MSKKILIVEDEKSYSDLVSAKLKSAGFEVETINTGGEAMEYLEGNRPDLVLLDIMLPDIDGLSILDNISKNKDLYGMPVIILSNLDQPGSFEQVKAIGDFEYLIKVHTELDDLVEKVSQKLNK